MSGKPLIIIAEDVEGEALSPPDGGGNSRMEKRVMSLVNFWSLRIQNRTVNE
jgi:hypothetical protein